MKVIKQLRKLKIIKSLNYFCLHLHDRECNGCIFRKCKRCPLNALVEKLENSL